MIEPCVRDPSEVVDVPSGLTLVAVVAVRRFLVREEECRDDRDSSASDVDPECGNATSAEDFREDMVGMH